MTLKEAVDRLAMRPVSAASQLSREFFTGYVSDLLSDVMANAKAGDVWVTLQVHQNIVAVATLKELAAIIIIGGREPQRQTLAKAEEENVPILVTPLSAFEVVGELSRMGVSGRR
jgi:predicted transcriptional regulator